MAESRSTLSETTRRRFLGDTTTGLAGVGLLHLLDANATASERATLAARDAPAKRVLQIFCPGAASHIDLWEHKPELDRRDGEALPGEEAMVSVPG